MKLNKKVRNIAIIAGIMLGLAVGCSSTEETTTDTEVTPSNQKIEASKGNDVIEEQEEAKKQEELEGKKKVAETIKQLGQDSMGEGYKLDVEILDDGTCGIMITDLNYTYSGYSKEVLEEQANLYNLPAIYGNLARNAEEVFEQAGYKGTTVMTFAAGADGEIFMIVNSLGIATFR